jgi:hypothetical protein
MSLLAPFSMIGPHVPFHNLVELKFPFNLIQFNQIQWNLSSIQSNSFIIFIQMNFFAKSTHF